MVKSLAEGMARLGHEVHVVTSTYGAENRPREEEFNRVSVNRVRSWRLHYPDLTISKEIPGNVIREADIVHGWSQNSYFTYRICREAKKLGKPVTMYFLGVDYLKHHYNPLIRLLGYPYQKWITRKVVEITNLALVTNEYEKKLLKERYGIDAIVLPHGVEEIYLKLPNMAEYFREKYDIKGRIVAYIGRIHPTKGLDLLISAFSEVVRQVPDAVLVIAGKGDEKYLSKCMKLAEKLRIGDKVKYLGHISEEDKIALIDASDAIVMPSRHAGESFPLLAIEIASRGRKLVMTRGSIASKWIEEQGLGRVASSNVDDLAKTIIDELRNSTTIVRYRRNFMTWKDIANTLNELYKRLVVKA